MEDLKSIVISIGLMLVGASLAFVAAWYWYEKRLLAEKAKNTADEHRILVNRVDDLDKKLALLSQSMMPMSTAFQSILVRELTHYHTPVMDALLKKLGPPYILTDDEEIELDAALVQRTKDMGELITDPERDAAKILPIVMKRVKAEAKAIKENRLELLTFVAIDIFKKEDEKTK